MARCVRTVMLGWISFNLLTMYGGEILGSPRCVAVCTKRRLYRDAPCQHDAFHARFFILFLFAEHQHNEQRDEGLDGGRFVVLSHELLAQCPDKISARNPTEGRKMARSFAPPSPPPHPTPPHHTCLPSLKRTKQILTRKGYCSPFLGGEGLAYDLEWYSKDHDRS